MKIYKNNFDKETLEIAESILFNGNGYLGVRNNLEEDFFFFDYYSNRETYLNGFYEIQEVSHPEKFVGFIDSKQTMIPVIDAQTSIIIIDGEKIERSKISNHSRYVDLEKGTTIREFTFTTSKGFMTEIKIERLTSLVHLPLFYTNYQFKKINHSEDIFIDTIINYKPIKTIDKDDPRMDHNILELKVDKNGPKIDFNTVYSGLIGTFEYEIDSIKETLYDDHCIIHSKVTGKNFVKKCKYLFNIDDIDFISFEELKKLQFDFMESFWKTSYVKVKSKDNIEEAINYGTYALLCSVGKEGKTSIAAKGLSGLGYEGHYFWDSEMYIFTNFLMTNPKLAKSILDFRLNTLEQAIKNAKSLGYIEGALFPWRTINGSECSPFFEAGMAQHHINCDIAFAFIQYYYVTNDKKYFEDGAINLLVEICKFFIDIVYFKDGKYHLDAVTGPDEYTTVVNDNYYTNKMIQYVFKNTLKMHELLKVSLLKKDELNKMADIVNKINLPLSTNGNLVAQDRNFFEKEKWDFEKFNKHPLLLHYHPLKIYRYQVSKQADAILALAIFKEQYEEEFLKNNLDYYETITTHDSSLSFSSFAIVYANIGSKKAYEYFLKNLRLDLDNIHQNTKDGIHTASIGGTYKVMLEGFLNMNINAEGVTFENKLPEEIEEVELNYMFKGKLYNLIANNKEIFIKEIND